MPAATAPDPGLRFARVASGARIAWAESGAAGAPVLVRVAHWMTNVEHDPRSPIWRPWLDRLGRRLRLVRYDERGCGRSGHDDTPPGLAAAVEELAAVVDACGSPRVALLGASGAAAAAIAYAVQAPERVSHLVLLGGYAHGLALRGASPDALALHETTVRLVELGWGRADPAVQRFFTTTMLPDAAPAEAAALDEQQRLSCDGRRAAAILHARARLDVRTLAPRVRCPTLVLHADGDLVVPPALGVELAGLIPGARFESLRTRNHLPLASDPAFDTFCERVSDFVHPRPSLPPLTARESALLDAVAAGLDNAQIGARFGVADKTVRNALSALYAKLGVEGRPQAIVAGRTAGLGGTAGHG